jgi:hypothetical protein
MPKFDPKQSRGEHQEQDAGESSPTEYDKEGKEMKGGGYYKKAGKLYQMKKSDDVSTDDLQKSLDHLEDFANAEDAISRKDELLARASAGELTKAENTELFELLGGGETPASSDPTVTDDITKSMTENEPLQKAVNVSDFLSENHDALVKSLTAVGEAIEKSDTRRHEFAMLQAKALVDIGNMVKSMSETIDELISQPISGPKSAGVQPGARPLQKSFGGQPPQEEQLNKSMVLDGLDGLMKKSMESGLNGRLEGTGEDISLATAKFEGSGQISPVMLEAVKRWRSDNQGAAH